jgi:LuxR family maltose regulon positive regulatory protein
MSKVADYDKQILNLVKLGLTNNTIASILGKSPDTIKYHLKKIYKKLGAGNRIEAINKFNELMITKH